MKIIIEIPDSERDVFIAAINEARQQLRRTLISTTEMPYMQKKISYLDEIIIQAVKSTSNAT